MLVSMIKRIFLSFTFILVYSASSQADTINFSVTASGGAYFIDGASRAELELTVGNTYVFTGFPGFHPLRLSTTDNGSWGGGVNYQDNVTTTSTSITIVVTGDTPTLFYYCQNHSGMGSSITISEPLVQPTILNISTVPGAYLIDGNTRQELTLLPGNTYTFDNIPSGHPLLLSTTHDGTHNGGSSYTEGVLVQNNSLTISVTENTPPLYYYCEYHPGMGSAINIPSTDNLVNYSVSDAGGAYYIDGAIREDLFFEVGKTYVFNDLVSSHPLLLSTVDKGTHVGGTVYTNRVTSTGDSLAITVSEDTPDLFYFCQYHANMGASISIVSEQNVPAMGLGGMLLMGLLLTAVVRRENRRIS
jgi:plastocyanin